MKPIRFVHCADLHIDSPFKGIRAAKQSVGEELREATFAAFRNIIKLCIDSKADFLVVAGDIYDGADRSIQAQLAFFDGLKELSEHGIRSFVAHGNHDPLAGWSSTMQWPAAVKIFGGRIESEVVFREKEPIASVSGISYRTAQEEKNLAKDFALQANVHANIVNIAILHCNVGSDSQHANYAPCTLRDLTSQKFHYWALGHVHDRKILAESPYVVYPGNTQGRHMRETGPRGCYLVEVNSEGKFELEFVNTQTIRWEHLTVGIDKVQSINQLDHLIDLAIAKELNTIGKESVICRLELTGRGSLYHELVHENSLYELLNRVRSKYQSNRQFCWIEDILLSCKSELNIEESRAREDLIGFVLREADDLSKNDLGQMLADVLNPVYQHALARGILKRPTSQELQKILEEAEIYCADLLESN